MEFTYYLVEITLLLFPIIAAIFSKKIDLFSNGIFKKLAIFFLIHNSLFLFNFSIKGDYPDYIIFSLEYLFACFAIYNIAKIKNEATKVVLKSIGYISICFGFIIGLVGILLFIVAAQEFETSRTFETENNYQIREYKIGFATFENTKYNYEFYKSYPNFPFEYKFNKISFFDNKINLNLDGELIFNVGEINDATIKITSSNGKTFIKTQK
jgi:hypothetical protein